MFQKIQQPSDIKISVYRMKHNTVKLVRLGMCVFHNWFKWLDRHSSVVVHIRSTSMLLSKMIENYPHFTKTIRYQIKYLSRCQHSNINHLLEINKWYGHHLDWEPYMRKHFTWVFWRDIMIYLRCIQMRIMNWEVNHMCNFNTLWIHSLQMHFIMVTKQTL